MSAAQSKNIRTAIRQLLEGSTGTVRIVPAGMFEGGVTAGHTLPGQQAKAIDKRYRHRFDVSIGRQSPNAGTPQSVLAPYRIADFEVTINVWTHLKPTTLDAEREDKRAEVEGDCDVAIQALNFPGNLQFTSTGRDTGIISGMLLGPSDAGTPVWELVEEDWAKHLLRSRITAVAKVKIVQPAAA